MLQGCFLPLEVALVFVWLGNCVLVQLAARAQPGSAGLRPVGGAWCGVARVGGGTYLLVSCRIGHQLVLVV